MDGWVILMARFSLIIFSLLFIFLGLLGVDTITDKFEEIISIILEILFQIFYRLLIVGLISGGCFLFWLALCI